MYRRVLPLGSVFTVSSGRVVVDALLSDALICAHVAPPSLERQTPRAYEAAYTVLGLDGSKSTRRTPRGEHGGPLPSSSGLSSHRFGFFKPFHTKLHTS